MEMQGEALLVGRRAEMDLLERALERAAGGHGGVVVLSGEAGIGKTRLARELAWRASRQGAVVAWGQCWEAGGAPAYWPWVEVLRGYRRERDVHDVLEALGPSAARLRSLVPDWFPPSPAAGAAGEHERFALFDAVRAFLSAAAVGAPLVVVLDDMHAADIPSLLLTEYVGRRLGGMRLLLVAAHRPAVLAEDEGRAEALRRIARDAALVPLVGLSRVEVAAFASQHGIALPSGELAALHDATGGNPFFLSTLLALPGGAGSVRGGVAVASRVAAIVRPLVNQSTDTTHEVLDVAAAAGRVFDVSLIAQFCGEEKAVGALDEALALGLVRKRDARRWSFAHGLVRDAIYETIALRRRVQIHLRLAQLLERSSAPASAVAHHYCHALPGCETEAARASLAAANDALQRLAWEEARAHALRARDVLEATPLEGELRCDVLHALASAEIDTADLLTARVTFSHAAQAARELGDAHRLARAAIGFLGPLIPRGHEPPVEALLDEARVALGSEISSLRAQVLAHLGMQALQRGDVDDAQRLASQALEVARGTGDPYAEGLALSIPAAVCFSPPYADRLLPLAEQIAALAARSDDAFLMVNAGMWSSVALLWLGDRYRSEALVADTIALLRRRAPAGHHAFPALLLAFAALRDGRFADVEAPCEEMLDSAAERQEGGVAQFAALLRFAARRESGVAGDEDLGLLARQRNAPQLARYAEALMLADAGDRQSAAALLDAAAEERYGVALYLVHEPALAWAAEAAVLVRSTRHAAALYAALTSWSSRYGVFSGVVFDRLLAGLATVLNRPGAARRHFEDGLAFCRRAGTPAQLVRTQYEYAAFLSAMGDLAASSQMAALAAAGREALGMRVATVGGQRVLGESVPPDASEEQAAPPRVRRFLREADHWVIVFDGDTARLRDTKGLRALALLLANAGREMNALDISAAVNEPSRLSLVRPQGDGGDTGLFGSGRRVRQRRLAELRTERAEALAANDPVRVELADAETEAIAAELVPAYGHAERARRSQSEMERARLSVTKALRTALERVTGACPALGRHLATTLRTGTFCSYRPDPSTPVTWDVGWAPRQNERSSNRTVTAADPWKHADFCQEQ